MYGREKTEIEIGSLKWTGELVGRRGGMWEGKGEGEGGIRETNLSISKKKKIKKIGKVSPDDNL